MGAYSPVPFIKHNHINDFVEQFVKPIINDLKNSGILFSGVLYAGFILTKNGPKILEINVRFGDPEAQTIFPRLKTDLLDLLLASSTGNLNQFKLPEWENNFCMNVVLSSKGYPKDYKKNTIINGLNKITNDKSKYVFHASTKKNGNHWLATGGRVLSISAMGSTLKNAKNNTYSIVNKIDWKGWIFQKRYRIETHTVSNKKNTLVSIIMGSQSDWEFVKPASKILKEFSIPHECKIISAHRTPDRHKNFSNVAKKKRNKSYFSSRRWCGAPRWSNCGSNYIARAWDTYE